MLIVCPNCASSYEVQADKLGAGGRSVRCVRCREVWFATAASETPAQLEAAAPPGNREGTGGPGEQIEGGEFGWTFAPEDGAGQAAAGAAEADQGAGFEPGAFEADPQSSPQSPPQEPKPETVSDAPGIAPVLDQDAAPPHEDKGPNEDVETLAAVRARRAAAKRKRQRGWRPGVPFVILALGAVVTGLVAGRTQVVRFAPQTASLYAAIGLAVNLRGLAFESVKTTRETSEGVTVLVVEGTIVNVTSRTVEVPRLRFGVRNGAGLEIYAWTSVPARTILAPGDAVEFRSRLASPPADARDVVVRFFNRRDIVAGVR